MKAFLAGAHLPTQDPDCLIERDLPLPSLLPLSVQVQIKAIAVNPIDTKVRALQGGYQAEEKVLGWDACGIVTKMGSEVENIAIGDCIYYAGCISQSGCNAEYQNVDYRLVAHAPRNLSHAQAAAIPLTSITAWESLFERLQIAEESPDKSLLVIGGAGGVGAMAIQLAKALSNVKVIATASRPESRDYCLKMGADKVIDHKQLLVEQLQAHSIDYILCCHDTSGYFEQMAELIAPLGKICVLVDSQSPLDMNKLKRKSVSFHWEFMFSRPLYDNKPEHHGNILKKLSRLIEQGQVHSTMTRSLSPINKTNLLKAHQKMEEGKQIGKLTLEGF